MSIELIGLRPKVITLCGSTRFKDEFISTNACLTGEGNIVLSVGFFGHEDNVGLTNEDKASLDNLHLWKISLSDSIYVINKFGYIGSSTWREIQFANQEGKVIQYMIAFPDIRCPICSSLYSDFYGDKLSCDNCKQLDIMMYGKPPFVKVVYDFGNYQYPFDREGMSYDTWCRQWCALQGSLIARGGRYNNGKSLLRP